MKALLLALLPVTIFTTIGFSSQSHAAEVGALLDSDALPTAHGTPIFFVDYKLPAKAAGHCLEDNGRGEFKTDKTYGPGREIRQLICTLKVFDEATLKDNPAARQLLQTFQSKKYVVHELVTSNVLRLSGSTRIKVSGDGRVNLRAGHLGQSVFTVSCAVKDNCTDAELEEALRIFAGTDDPAGIKVRQVWHFLRLSDRGSFGG